MKQVILRLPSAIAMLALFLPIQGLFGQNGYSESGYPANPYGNFAYHTSQARVPNPAQAVPGYLERGYMAPQPVVSRASVVIPAPTAATYTQPAVYQQAVPVNIPQPAVQRQPQPQAAPRNISREEWVITEIRRRAEDMSRLGLPYVFGGSTPVDGGLDCSGTMMYLLSPLGYHNIPRTSYLQYEWLKNQGRMVHTKKIPEKAGGRRGLNAGDLIFWGGTYASGHRVSHVMIYLGQGRDGTHYMFGARGQTMKGMNGSGVDIFPLKTGRHDNLVGFGPLPGIG